MKTAREYTIASTQDPEATMKIVFTEEVLDDLIEIVGEEGLEEEISRILLEMQDIVDKKFAEEQNDLTATRH